jgi:ubiquitin C-terminal hydrolase
MECKKRSDRIRDKAIQFETFVLDALKKYPSTPEEYSSRVMCNVTSLEDYNCENCKKVGARAIRIHQLVRVGRMMVTVHNKYTVNKTRYSPQAFNINDLNGAPLTYNMVAHIEHTGSLMGGHYWAHVRRNGTDYVANDSSIRQGALQPSINTYAIFYELTEGQTTQKPC